MTEISLSEALNAYLENLHIGPSIPETDGTTTLPESNNKANDATTLPETNNKLENEANGSLTDTDIEKLRKPLLAELDKLCNAMPDPEAYDDSGFDSTINKDRFEKHLDHKQTLIYKRTDTWDHQPVEVGLLIPKGINWTKNVGILVKWHGGALGGSRWDYAPWFAAHLLRLASSCNAIILAPNYRLMPTASGSAILSDVSSFWNWFRASCYPSSISQTSISFNSSDPIPSHPSPSSHPPPPLPTTLDPTRLLLTGDSAGAFLAIYSWLLFTPSIPIRALYLSYPMTNHYSWPASRSNPCFTTTYRSCTLSSTQSNTYIDNLHSWLRTQKLKDRLPAITGRTPPSGSPCNAHLGITGRWREVFQDEETTMDIPELIRDLKGKGERPSLPYLWVHHGWDDEQCGVEETRGFVEGVRGWYEEKGEGEKVKFVVVRGLRGERKGIVGHGYDHDLEEEKEEWLGEIMEGLRGVWGIGEVIGLNGDGDGVVEGEWRPMSSCVVG